MNQNLKGFGSFVVATLFLGCSSLSHRNYLLTPEERAICIKFQIDTTIILDIRENNSEKIEAFHYSLSKQVVDGKFIESDPIYLKGLVFQEKNKKSYDLVLKLKNQFTKKGYSLFLLENNFGLGDNPDQIGILKTTNKYDVLKQVGTDGINYEITNDSLLKLIQPFDKKYTLELIGASGDWCEFIIKDESANWIEFANEVYKVCPDVVDQGIGSIEALAEELKKTKRLYLWWD